MGATIAYTTTLYYTFYIILILKGTPNYESPEIINASMYGNKTDIWSLGCVVYEVMEQKLAFSSPTRSRLHLATLINE